jgi:hypothetical protein
VTVIDKGRFTMSLPAGITSECPAGGEEDFDGLLAASSLGSEQARAIREQAPAAAREHARRVLGGEEKCAPVECDIDDAVGGLVNGLARRSKTSSLLIINDSHVTARDLVLQWDPGREPFKHVFLSACLTDALAADQRLILLEALVDHDAFAGLRSDVCWIIINSTFDMMPRTPRVLLDCADLAFRQVDVSALALAWSARQDLRPASSALFRGRPTELRERRAPRPRAPERAVAMRAACPARPAITSGDVRLQGSSLPLTLAVMMLLISAIAAAAAWAVTEPAGWAASGVLAGAVGCAVTAVATLRRRAVGIVLRRVLPAGISRRRSRGNNREGRPN